MLKRPGRRDTLCGEEGQRTTTPAKVSADLSVIAVRYPSPQLAKAERPLYSSVQDRTRCGNAGQPLFSRESREAEQKRTFARTIYCMPGRHTCKTNFILILSFDGCLKIKPKPPIIYFQLLAV